ncbi:Zn peptidase [Candidatus Burkholderia humilis]|nr:Zn peptidase [Candidatus Burkholderia humilis]
MVAATARSLIRNHWNGHLPIDPTPIARAVGVEVMDDSDMGSVLGRFDYVDGRPHIYVNSKKSALCQRFTIAHELGHYALRHGDSFEDSADQFVEIPRRLVELEANKFAAFLLVPGSAVEHLIMRRNIVDPQRLMEIFDVSEVVLETSLDDSGGFHEIQAKRGGSGPAATHV